MSSPGTHGREAWRNRNICLDRSNGETLRSIGGRYGLTPERIWQIHMAHIIRRRIHKRRPLVTPWMYRREQSPKLRIAGSSTAWVYHELRKSVSPR